MIYLQLFVTFLQIGLFAFGGGYAAMPLIQTLVVEGRGWLTMAEFADLTTIAEMTPGPIAVNAATFVGQKMAGAVGSVVCTLGCITPSLIIVLILGMLYTRYRELRVVKTMLAQLRPAVVAMIAGAGLTIFLLAMFGTSTLAEIRIEGLRVVELGLFVAALVLLRVRKVSPIFIIFASAVAGVLVYMVFPGLL